MIPPLACSVWPLTQAPSGPARKVTTFAMSYGWPSRSRGASFASRADAPRCACDDCDSLILHERHILRLSPSIGAGLSLVQYIPDFSPPRSSSVSMGSGLADVAGGAESRPCCRGRAHRDEHHRRQDAHRLRPLRHHRPTRHCGESTAHITSCPSTLTSWRSIERADSPGLADVANAALTRRVLEARCSFRRSEVTTWPGRTTRRGRTAPRCG